MEQNRLVTIVTPMFKGAPFIGEAIDSVVRQTYENWEMIIVDDCSPDNGAGIEIVERYMAMDSRINLIALAEKKGSSGARNTGIRAARGDFIAFLDSDDLWSEHFIEKQLDFMERRKADIAFSSYRRIHEKSKKEILAPFIVPPRVNYKAILKSLPIFPSTAVMDISRIGKFYFDESMGCVRDDYVFWLNILKHHVGYAHGNREVLASYRLRSDSVTANKFKMIRPHWNVLRKVEQMPFLKSAFYLGCWIYKSFWKYVR